MGEQPTIDDAVAGRRAHMPAQKPGRSEQIVVTPPDLMAAVERRWGVISFDLAATRENSKARDHYFGPGSRHGANALEQHWGLPYRGVLWLNPPFGRTPEAPHGLADWTAKAAASMGSTILLLCPASVGSNWWARNVDGKASVIFLTGRVTFVGHTSAYPKDLALLVYSNEVPGEPGYECWPWGKSLAK